MAEHNDSVNNLDFIAPDGSYQEKVLDYLAPLGNTFRTAFNELTTASRDSQMNFKPTWGVSSFRYTTTETGTGAGVSESNGEFLLQSGTDTSSEASIETNQRGQYKAGSVAEAGVGVRYPTAPTGTQLVKWGYSDFSESGFYFGEDATGKFVAYITGGSETKVYQSDWNGDKADGTGVSGLTLDYSKGVITHINFTWYGYGAIEYSVYVYNTKTKQIQRVVLHTIKKDSSASIIDPNQPLKFSVQNGASSTSNLALYIGGHQFSVYDGGFVSQKRILSELLTNYTTATNTDWQPIMAFRKKSTFNGRPNSVNVSLEHLEVSGDGEFEVRTTYGGTTSNLSWGAPTGISASETAVETKVTGGTALTTSADGTPLDYGFVAGAGNKQSTGFADDVVFTIASTEEVILWIRRLSGTGAIIVKHAHITWQEEW